MTAALAASALMPTQAAAVERTISVTGSATQQVPNDTAGLGFSVTKERRSRVAALRIASVRMRAVIEAVQAFSGIGPGDVTTGRVTVRKVTREGRTLYRATQSISVVLHQPERAGEMISAAVGAGATGTTGPNFFPGDPEAAYANALLAAFDQARAKAAALATRAGDTLGPAITIDEGTRVVPSQPKSVSQHGAGESPPVKPGASTVTATVSVVFALQ
jgi:uncharacterized protein YggE